jgi:hypothetical protein
MHDDDTPGTPGARWNRRACLAAAGALPVLASGLGRTATAATLPADVPPYSATPRPEWDALFRRSSGWTGADGLWLIPMSGDERPGTGGATRTFFWFSDTFVGTVRPNGSRVNSTLVNNTSAMLTGDQPDAGQIAFSVRSTASGAATALVQPDQTQFPGQWFWPLDGIVDGDRLLSFTLRITPANTPPFAFAFAGVSLLAAPAADAAPFAGRYRQIDTPLFEPASDLRGETTFGQCVMPLTARAGAPAPDGYVYVYGMRTLNPRKGLVVSRVPEGRLTQFSAYRFWDGRRWVADIAAAKVVTAGVSAEFSVHPLADGRFLCVHMADLLGRTVMLRYGSSPVGPWGEDIPVWDCPETALTPNVFVYGAKAHPHLGAPGELLISYHANTFDFAENFTAGGVDIYRPRFISVPV